MPLRPNLSNLLTEYLMVRKKDNTSYHIARTMLWHLDELPTMKTETLARLAGTTPASVTKFCRELGFRGYIDMRVPAPGTTVIQPSNMPTGSDYRSTINQWIANQNQLMYAFAEGYDTPAVRDVAQRVAATRNIIVVTGTYGFAAVDLFLEQMVDTHIKAIPINRGADHQLLESSVAGADLCLVISLTGAWYREHAQELGLTRQNTVVVSQEALDDATVVRLDVVPDFFASMQTTLTSLTVFFTMLSAMVHDELGI